MREDDLPAERQDAEDEMDAAIRGEDEDDAQDASLSDEILALVDDGKTYAEAELAFQKSRAGFVANRTKDAALFGMFALGFVHLALIALVVGVLIALTPVIGPWGATAAVVGALLLMAVILLLFMRSRGIEIADAFKGNGK
ncbi:MAG: phage holin family protein [Erythrobacter sp.]